MRDTRKSKDYFIGYLNEIEPLIDKGIKAIESGEVAENRLAVYKMYVLKNMYGRGIALYSLGTPQDELKNEFNSLFKMFPGYWDSNICKVKVNRGQQFLKMYWLDHYTLILNLLSIAVLLNIDSGLKKIDEVLLRDEVGDKIFEYILNKTINDRNRIKEAYTDDVIMLELYKNLRESIEVANYKEKVELLKDHLHNSFYNKHYHVYNTHKSIHNAYYGYWSFETAALAALFKIDDIEFKDNPYFPTEIFTFYKENFV